MLKCNKTKIAEILIQEECKNIAKQKVENTTKIGRPVVVSQKRFNSLKSHSSNNKRLSEDVETEKEQRERMKLAAEALVANFTGNIQRTPEQKLAEIKRNMEEKTAKARASINASQEVREELRREKIARAEALIQKLKPGPRELKSAAIQSEMLRARDVQVEVNNLIQDSYKKQELADKTACIEQSNIFLGEDQERIQEKQEKEKALKAEMLETIRENTRLRCENKKKLLEEQRLERAQIDADIKAQIERERQALEKKRAMLRKNAIEAMKMDEERKKRAAMFDETEERLSCVYNAGRYQLEKLKTEQAQTFASERQNQIDRNFEMLAQYQAEIQNKEADRIRRDISIMKLKFDAQEEEKRRHERESKKQRIEAHLQEMEHIRLVKEREAEIRRFEVAQRFKNQEVNARFYAADRMEQLERAKCVRAMLMAQEQERQRVARERETKTRICDNKRFEQDDNFFFKYAYTLIEDASRKERSLYPFRKVVNEYKKKNMTDLKEPKLPRHMVTSLIVKDSPIVVTETCNTKPKPPISKVKAETLEHMAKIDAMLAEDDRRRAALSKKSCKPFRCVLEGTKEKNVGLQFEKTDSEVSKVQYGINELKQLCTPAPPVH